MCGCMTDAYVSILIDPGAISAAASEIADIDAVEAVHLVTGEYDVIARIELESSDDLPAVVADEIHSVPGVVDTVTNVAFEP